MRLIYANKLVLSSGSKSLFYCLANSKCFLSSEQFNTSSSSSSRKRYNKPPPIDLKNVRVNYEKRSDDDKESHGSRQNDKLIALTFLGIPLITFALGCWQIKRREWKLNLIDMLNKRTKTEVRDLPKDAGELQTLVDNFEYCPFRVRGHFLHSKEILLTIKHDLTQTIGGPGGLVITPFVLSDRANNATILVNRGFVPHTNYSPASRMETQNGDNEVELVGLLRRDEITNKFTLKNKPPFEWHYRDINLMSQTLGTMPIFLDQIDKKRTVVDKSLPVPNQTAINLRNEHMSYIVTWFSLSLITSFLWWKRFARVLF